MGGPVVRQSACPLWCHLLVRVELEPSRDARSGFWVFLFDFHLLEGALADGDAQRSAFRIGGILLRFSHLFGPYLATR